MRFDVEPQFARFSILSVSEKSSIAAMSSLRLQKRLAAGVMKCGKNKVCVAMAEAVN